MAKVYKEGLFLLATSKRATRHQMKLVNNFKPQRGTFSCYLHCRKKYIKKFVCFKYNPKNLIEETFFVIFLQSAS